MTVRYQGSVLPPVGFDLLRMAAAAYLARFKGQSRAHAETDLRAFLVWCTEGAVDPLATTRPHVELYVRWMQEQGRYAASTVARRLSIVAGFYRTWSSTECWSTPRRSSCAAPPCPRPRRHWG
jgi:site-specific recombinase XerD